jgi:hypothetical protein
MKSFCPGLSKFSEIQISSDVFLEIKFDSDLRILSIICGDSDYQVDGFNYGFVAQYDILLGLSVFGNSL